VAQGAIAWLLIRPVAVQREIAGGEDFTATTFVQRLNTTGGIGAVGWLRVDAGRRQSGVRAVYRGLRLLRTGEWLDETTRHKNSEIQLSSEF
jgi:hypothetical protein